VIYSKSIQKFIVDHHVIPFLHGHHVGAFWYPSISSSKFGGWITFLRCFNNKVLYSPLNPHWYPSIPMIFQWSVPFK
jgi:hypothetical protein